MQKTTKITETTHRLLRSATDSDEFQAFLDLLFETGATPFDLLALRSDNINLQTKQLVIFPQKVGQAATELLIPIDDRIEQILRELPKTGKLFPNLNPRNVLQEFLRIRRHCLHASTVTVHSYRAAKLFRVMKGGR